MCHSSGWLDDGDGLMMAASRPRGRGGAGEELGVWRGTHGTRVTRARIKQDKTRQDNTHAQKEGDSIKEEQHVDQASSGCGSKEAAAGENRHS